MSHGLHNNLFPTIEAISLRSKIGAKTLFSSNTSVIRLLNIELYIDDSFKLNVRICFLLGLEDLAMENTVLSAAAAGDAGKEVRDEALDLSLAGEGLPPLVFRPDGEVDN